MPYPKIVSGTNRCASAQASSFSSSISLPFDDKMSGTDFKSVKHPFSRSSSGPTQVAASHEQDGKPQIATVCSKPFEGEFFDGTGFSSLSSYAQNMAMAMKESPIQALRKHLQMRGLSDADRQTKQISRVDRVECNECKCNVAYSPSGIAYSHFFMHKAAVHCHEPISG